MSAPFVVNTTPEAAYATKPNIVHPQSERGSAGEPYVVAAEGRAQADIATRIGPQVAVTTATIKRGR